MDPVSLIWYAGSLAMDLVLFVLLLRSVRQAFFPGSRLGKNDINECTLQFADKIRRGSSSWMGRILCVLGEAGGSMLLVAFIALVLAIVWRGGVSIQLFYYSSYLI